MGTDEMEEVMGVDACRDEVDYHPYFCTLTLIYNVTGEEKEMERFCHALIVFFLDVISQDTPSVPCLLRPS